MKSHQPTPFLLSSNLKSIRQIINRNHSHWINLAHPSGCKGNSPIIIRHHQKTCDSLKFLLCVDNNGRKSYLVPDDHGENIISANKRNKTKKREKSQKKESKAYCRNRRYNNNNNTLQHIQWHRQSEHKRQGNNPSAAFKRMTATEAAAACGNRLCCLAATAKQQHQQWNKYRAKAKNNVTKPRCNAALGPEHICKGKNASAHSHQNHMGEQPPSAAAAAAARHEFAACEKCLHEKYRQRTLFILLWLPAVRHTHTFCVETTTEMTNRFSFLAFFHCSCSPVAPRCINKLFFSAGRKNCYNCFLASISTSTSSMKSALLSTPGTLVTRRHCIVAYEDQVR